MKRQLWMQGALVLATLGASLATARIARAQIDIDPPLPDPSPQPAPAPSPAPSRPAPVPPTTYYPQAQQLQVQPPSSPAQIPASDDEDEKTTASTKLEVGASARRLYGFGVYGIDGRIGVGARGSTLGHFGSIGFFWGETSERLRTYSVTAGYDFELYVGPGHFGFGIEGGLLWVRRASVDARLFAPGIGASVHAGLDLVKLGRRHAAMYLDLRLQGALYIDDAPFWGPTLSVGFRF